MKGNPQDLHDLGEDLQKTIDTHQDALRHNPDIAAELMKTRAKVRDRYESVMDRPRGFDKDGNLIP